MAVALTRGRSQTVPAPALLAAQAVVGVALGSEVAPSALGGLAGAWWIVLLTVVLTLGLSAAVALGLARLSRLDRLTAVVGMLPGAAPALIAVGDELGADARVVATMQYGRVLLVVASVPVLVLALGADPGGAAGGGAPASDTPSGVAPALAAGAAAAAGFAVAALARLPAASLVGPLALSALATVTGVATIHVPAAVADAAFVVVGASVGLSFDRPSLRRIGRLAPGIAAAVLVLTAVCAGLAVALLRALDTDPVTAYLATTPGGISSVLAAALDTGADLTVVIAVQTMRLMLLALVAPFAARVLRVRAAA